MASTGLREDLRCSICLNIYTEPVTMQCGHNFCRNCIDQALSTQDGYRVYSCPECRTEFDGRPMLMTNINLHNIAERLRSTQPHREEVTGICCTYCVDNPVPAVRYCLLCETSLCDNHLKVHSKEAEHILTDPRASLENRRCSIHKKILEYYCTEDAACICASCCLIGEHNGHEIQSIKETSEKKKMKMRGVWQTLITKRAKTKERVHNIEIDRMKFQEKAAGEAKKVTALFIDIKVQLDNLEKRVLREISRQEEQMSLSLSALIQKLQIKTGKLTRKMRHIQELCNTADPLTVLQEPDTGVLCDPEEEGGDEDTGGPDETHDVDVDVITGMLHAGFSDIMTYLQTISPAKPGKKRKRKSPPSHTQASPMSGRRAGGEEVTTAGDREIYGQGPADILLGVNTAAKNILVSDDLKSATWTRITQNHPQERFKDYSQVISSNRFSSGRHYWDVELSGAHSWIVGMCYPSIGRRGRQSHIGYNNKSWGLWGGEVYNHECSVIHDSTEIQLPHQISSNRVRICLDYEAGQLSFYELRDTIIPIYTFTATFTEPLHAALYVNDSCVKILGGEEQL